MNIPNVDSAREVILGAAEKLFAQKGFAGASMRALAGAAGVSQALIHHHFGTKRGLYEAMKCALGERCLASTVPALEPQDGDAPGSTLERAMFRYAAWLNDNPNFRRISLWAHLEGDETPMGMSAEDHEMPAQVSALLSDLQAEGGMRADLDTSLFMLMVGGVVEHWVQHREQLAAFLGGTEDTDKLEQRYLKQAIAVLLAGSLPAGVETPLAELGSAESEIDA